MEVTREEFEELVNSVKGVAEYAAALSRLIIGDHERPSRFRGLSHELSTIRHVLERNPLFVRELEMQRLADDCPGIKIPEGALLPVFVEREAPERKEVLSK